MINTKVFTSSAVDAHLCITEQNHYHLRSVRWYTHTQKAQGEQQQNHFHHLPAPCDIFIFFLHYYYVYSKTNMPL